MRLLRPSSLTFALSILVFAPRVAAAWSSDPAVDDLAGGGPQNQIQPAIVSDGAGGAFVGWTIGEAVYVQRLDASGARLWGATGTVAADAPGGKNELSLATDGAGGLLVSWSDARPGAATIYVQRFDSGGVPLWQEDGVPVYVNVQRLRASESTVLSDGAGGAYVSYEPVNFGGVTHVGVQRISANGTRLFTDAGLGVGTAGEARAPQMIPDGTGGVYVVWYTLLGTYPLRAQRVSQAGAEVWPADLTISTIQNNYAEFTVAADGTDGFFVSWINPKNNL